MDNLCGRKRKLSRIEALSKLQEHKYYFSEVAEEICQDLLPQDSAYDEETSFEVENLSKTVKTIAARLKTLHEQYKKRQFRHCPEKLDETFVSASQYSIFDSQASNASHESGGISNAFQSTQADTCCIISHDFRRCFIKKPSHDFRSLQNL